MPPIPIPIPIFMPIGNIGGKFTFVILMLYLLMFLGCLAMLGVYCWVWYSMNFWPYPKDIIERMKRRLS